MTTRLIYPLLTLLFISLSAYGQSNVKFIEEYIDFELDREYFYINGIFSFYNSGEKEINQKINFPFAKDAIGIDSIRVYNINNLKDIPFLKLKDGISFTLEATSKDTINVNIFYRQKSVETNNYIITSTQLWNNPLEKAIYTLTLPNDIKIKQFSYVPDSKELLDSNKVLYRWKKENFMPENDFEVIVEF